MLLTIYTLALTTLLQIRQGAVAFSTCVVPHQAGADDTPAIHGLLPSCSSNSRILFEKGITYNISTPVDFGTLNSVEIAIEGNLELPQNIPYVQSIVEASSQIHWFTVSGTNVTISGSQDQTWGWIDSFGEAWWRAAQLNNPGGLSNRPHLWSLRLTNSVVRWLKLRKPIAWCFSLSGNNIRVYGITIDASYDLSKPDIFPFNTDGFDVSGANIIIENSNIFNGDDCVAINSNTRNVTIRGLTCRGGHGMSVSGTNNISGIHFDSCLSQDSLYATRFKSSLSSTGNITDVVWSNIQVQNSTFPIFATNVYVDQNTNRGKTPEIPANSTATHISNFIWKNISGTINSDRPGDGSCITNPCWYAVPGLTNTGAIALNLLDTSATNIITKNISLSPIDEMGTTDVFCKKSSFTDDGSPLGFVCQDGPYEVTH